MGEGGRDAAGGLGGAAEPGSSIVRAQQVAGPAGAARTGERRPIRVDEERSAAASCATKARSAAHLPVRRDNALELALA